MTPGTDIDVCSFHSFIEVSSDERCRRNNSIWKVIEEELESFWEINQLPLFIHLGFVCLKSVWNQDFYRIVTAGTDIDACFFHSFIQVS